MIVEVVEEVAIFAKPCAVSDAVCVAIVDGLVDGTRAVGFSGMDGGVEVIFSDKGEGLGMFIGGIVDFAAGQVESDDTFIFEGDGEFGEAERTLRWHVAHGANNLSTHDAVFFLCFSQSSGDGFDDDGEGQAFFLV